jgi:hypothetical protein
MARNVSTEEARAANLTLMAETWFRLAEAQDKQD